MWEVKKEVLKTGITKYKLLRNKEIISFRTWINDLKTSEEFTMFFIGILKDSEYEAFFWEVKPINQKCLDNDFEFVLVESQSLRRIKSDDSFFKKYFKAGAEVVSFPNLGGDAQLVVPTQIAASVHYNHLANFVRNCPSSQVLRFWKKLAEEYEGLIGQEYKWLSTAGLGVYWLHVRIDSRPKYYRFENYKSVE